MKSVSDFLHTALHAYENIQCNTVEEFNSDLNRIMIIRKMVMKYRTDGDLSYRLVLNHFVILFNVFGANALKLILFKIEPELYPCIFPFLKQINRLPVEMDTIEFDEVIVKELETMCAY
jgi:hypothetical protein